MKDSKFVFLSLFSFIALISKPLSADSVPKNLIENLNVNSSLAKNANRAFDPPTAPLVKNVEIPNQVNNSTGSIKPNHNINIGPNPAEIQARERAALERRVAEEKAVAERNRIQEQQQAEKQRQEILSTESKNSIEKNSTTNNQRVVKAENEISNAQELRKGVDNLQGKQKEEALLAARKAEDRAGIEKTSAEHMKASQQVILKKRDDIKNMEDKKLTEIKNYEAKQLEVKQVDDKKKLQAKQLEAKQVEDKKKLQAKQLEAKQVEDKKKLQAKQLEAKQVEDKKKLQAKQLEAKQVEDKKKLQAKQLEAKQVEDKKKLQAKQLEAKQVEDKKKLQAKQLEAKQIDDKKKLQKNYSPRNNSGQATYTITLPTVKGPSWLKGKNSAMLPAQTAERINGKLFTRFDQMRSAIWKDIGNDPVLSKNFSKSNQQLMQQGKAPFALPSQHRGERKRYELDHSKEIQDGGSVYDLSNIRIKTPAAHVQKITRKFKNAAEKKK